MRCHIAAVLLSATSAAAGQTTARPVVLMEPVGTAGRGLVPTYRLIDDPARVAECAAWLENEHAAMALDLYERAWRTVRSRDAGDEHPPTPPYHVALVPKGNHADVGFLLETGDGVVEHPALPYIKLDPDPREFRNTLLHETGHVVLAVLAGGRRIPAEPIASIPHSTAALTNRGTAFNEGFAIHLETLAAHLLDDPLTRATYRHERFRFGGDDWRHGEYFRQAIDLRNYAQTVARYYEVRENSYAFASACREPDYLRVQLEKSRDFANLRDANQLLQSEGFYASFFFACLVRGDETPARETISARQDRMLDALADVLASSEPGPETPYLLEIVETFLESDPAEGGEVLDVLLDLSHGVFVDAEAPSLWRRTYMAALVLDVEGFPPPDVQERRRQWRRAVLDDPAVLRSRLGPAVRCVVPQREVTLVAFGRAMPLSFDANTVQEGIMRMVPQITDEAVGRWLAERSRQPFGGGGDFLRRVGRDEPWAGNVEIREPALSSSPAAARSGR